MRRMVLAHALLVGATGCNWAFGLNPTQPWDAGDAPPDSPPGVKSALVWGAVTTDGQGTPDATIEYAGIGSETIRPEVPRVEVGPVDPAMGSLAEVSYSAVDGTFEVPYNLREAPHRIVYTLPGETTPREIQWARSDAHIVVPRYMRMNAPLVPPGSGFSITPTGSGGGPVGLVHTSGVFTVNDVPADFDSATPTLTFRFADKARPLSKPLGKFESAKGDWVLLTDWKSHTGFTSVSAWALAPNVDLSPSTLTMPTPQPAWNTVERMLSTGMCPGANCFPTTGVGAANQRMSDMLGPLIDTSTEFQRTRYGIVPTVDLPPYLPAVAPDFIDRSTIQYFAEAYQDIATFVLADPSQMLPGYQTVADGLVMASRTVHGVTLYSSMQEMLKTSNVAARIKWSAPLPTSIKLGSTSLSGADDVSFPATDGQVELSFSPDNNNGSDYIITLAELAAGTLVPVRQYQVIAPSVKVDGTLLQRGHTYVFMITARSGLPNAQQGDYRTVSWPFSVTTTAAATFVVQ
ncbi:MAG: hypothetical protein HOV81_32565 [Kofleriaceae bacterium]|nr:hypothetical protein [Kofleriaceae bacterium]